MAKKNKPASKTRKITPPPPKVTPKSRQSHAKRNKPKLDVPVNMPGTNEPIEKHFAQ